ncbi:MAG: 1-deoxy-D-xylulose-5-phosphate reductoisomerase [Balneolales bacterium]
MEPQNLLILGSTGSIGTQTLEIVKQHPNRFRVYGLTAHKNWKLLARQINIYKPKFAILTDGVSVNNLRELINHNETQLLEDNDSLTRIVEHEAVDVVVNSLVGFSGFLPTYFALKAGKKVALANKESLVVGGELLSEYNNENGKPQNLLPIDSEHSAILQCLAGESEKSIEKLIITASGGPFRSWDIRDMEYITVDDALDHPNWDMGSKITIDSATMMNKGLEIIEAHWLFNIPLERIEAVVHPQSIIHSMVTFTDGSTKAQMGLPDMMIPIQYALSWPDRWDLNVPRQDWAKLQQLTFESVDYSRFPCMRLAIETLKEGGHAPAILNAANEVAVNRFLNHEITYIQIAKIIEKSLENITSRETLSISSLENIDSETRNFAKNITFKSLQT